MQRTKNRIRNIVIVLLNIFMVASLVIILKFKNNIGYSMYWVATPFLIILVISVILKWSVRGLNADKSQSNVIQRSFDDTTTILTVFFGIIYLFIHGAEYWYQDIKNNTLVIIGFFIVMIIYELFTYLAIYSCKERNCSITREEI